MGKKSKKPKIEVTDYYLSQHFGICLATVDSIKDVLIDEKSVISAPITTNSITSINLPELFGGIEKEGGAVGNMQTLMGANDQLLPDLLAQKLGRAGGSDAPGYRGLASLFFYGPSSSRGFKWKSNVPFVPGVWAKVQRILKRANGTEQWYAEKAVINTCGQAEGSEAIIRVEFLNNSWSEPGLGYLISGFASGLNDRTDEIPASEIETTSQDHFNVVYPGERIDFYWRDPYSPLPVKEFLLQMQWRAGQTDSDDRIRVSIKQPQMADFQVLAPKAGSFDVNPDPGGWLKTGNLFPRRYYFDTIAGAAPAGDNLDINPAHMIYECLTDREWGMGTPASSLDDAAFRAAADTLHNENFGLSAIFTRQGEIQTFINEILDHIQGVLYTDPATGLLVLDLIRDDYDEATLPVISPDDADLTNFSRKLWGDIVNEIVVTWTNPDNEQDETITAQDNASIAVQGGIVSDSRNYYMVRCARLAQDLAFRDLRSAGQPLATLEAVVDRAQYALRPASVIKVTWPEYGLNELVCRVQSVDYGKPGDPEIRLNLIEDVYGLDIGAYDTPPSTSWIDPSRDPEAVDPVRIFTLPYFMAVNSDVASFIAEANYPEVLAGVLGSAANDDAWELDLYDEITQIDGTTSEQRIATLNVVGSGELGGALDREASSSGVTLANLIGNTVPTQSGFILIGDGTEATDELALITADDGAGNYTLSRGVLDTVPREWPAGTQVWFVDEGTVFEDPEIRSASEVADYRLLMRTSQGTFPLASASLESHTLTERPWLPLRPANVEIDGQSFSSISQPIDQTAAYVDFPVTWSNRNRLEEDSQVLGWGDAGVTLEAGQTTTIEVRDLAGTLITEHTGITGSSFDLPLASFGAEDIAEVRIFAERSDADGDFVSLQYHSEWVRVAGTARRTEANQERITEADDTRLLED